MSDDRLTAPPAAPGTGLSDEDPFGALRPGAQVGKYEIVETLGQGGFGITYRARDGQLRRDVAVKEYLPTSFAFRQGGTTVMPRSTQVAEDFRWGRERFLDEARTLATLEEAPGIVNVYDFMEANGTAYMVMALVRGETLETRLKRERRLPQTAIEQLLYPLLEGLEKVHEAGFLHRDIKPANVVLDSNGRPTLIDFGASRAALQGRTQTLTAVYTPGYAAFEQSTSARQGPWTDIYALAATLYHCIAGTPPPAASDRMIDDRLTPAAEAGKARYAPSLLAAIDAGLKLKSSERPQSIAEWRRVLSGTAADRAADPACAAAPGEDEGATRVIAELAAPRPRRQNPLLWTAAGVIALSVLGGGGWMVLRAPSAPPEDVQARSQAEAQQRQAALDAKRHQEDESRRSAEEKAVMEAAARRETEEAERQRAAAAEARRQAEEAAIRKAAEEKTAAEAAARRKAEQEAEARRQAEAEAIRTAAAQKAAAEAEARRRTEETLAARKAAEEKAAAEAAARRQAEEEALRKRIEEEVRAELEAARKAAAEKAAAEERARAEANAKRAAEEEKARSEAEAKGQAEAAEAALHLSSDDRKRVQVALTALGHNTEGADGVFGPRTRQMIAAWQESQGAPQTGHLTATQLTSLRQQAASAIARFDEEEKRRAEEEARRLQQDEARKRAEEERRRQQQVPPPSVAVAPPTGLPDAATTVDGHYTGEHCSGPSPDRVRCGNVRVVVRDGIGAYRFGAKRCGRPGVVSFRIDASGRITGMANGFDSDCQPRSGPVWGKAADGRISLETRGTMRANLAKR